MTTIDNDFLAKISNKFCCKLCDYYTDRKFNLIIHNNSIKHKNNENDNENNSFLVKTSKTYNCENCHKLFNDRAGLWRHRKKCLSKDNNISDKEIDMSTKELVLMLFNQNNALQQSLIEMSKQTSTVNNTINNNKTFNLQIFLNETCKDAMNISDFIESVKLQVSDLENVGKVGYIEGISNIIIKNLNALDVEKRPVHCTDQKREVIYVKDENAWEKEDENNKKLRKAIRMIAHKNICMFKQFREKYPDCEEYDSKKNSQYNKLVYEAMGGKGDNEYEKDTKIIKKIAKVVGIKKE
jgi:hypothetical protein